MKQHCTSDYCDTPTSHTLCPACRDRLAQHLAETPWHLDQLTTQATKQSRLGDNRGTPRAKSTTAPLVMDPRAADQYHRFTRLLGRAQGAAADYLGEPVRPPHPASASRYLLAALTSGRLNGWAGAGSLLDDLTDVSNAALRIVDIPPESRFAGKCDHLVPQPDGSLAPCGTAMYSTISVGNVTCSYCGTEHHISERSADLLSQADDQQAPARIIAKALVTDLKNTDAIAKLESQIVTWGARRRLLPKRHGDVNGVLRPFYRVGDVRDLLAEKAQREQERRLNPKRSRRTKTGA